MIPLKSNDTSYEITILIGLSIIGILVKLFLSPSTSNLGDIGPATASVWGYGITAFSLFTLFFITFSLANSSSIVSTIMSSIPILLLLGIVASLIIINGMFLERINKGNIPKDYSNLSIISTVLVSLQLFFAFSYLLNKLKVERSSNPEINKYISLKAWQMGNISYVFGLFNVLAIGGSYIILKYFSTDG
jgi:hypothetical protein